MESLAQSLQSLPLEIIDMIVEYVATPSSKWEVHSCQYRKCLGKWYQEHNVDILNLVQVCRRYRHRFLPKLWSTVLVRHFNYKSLNNFIWSTPDRETLYLQHVKYILFEPVTFSRYRSPIRDDWFDRDENKPYGLHVKGASFATWAFKQTMFSMQNRNVEHMDIMSSRGVAVHDYYEFADLLPFWLSVSNGSSSSGPAITDFAKLRAILTEAYTNDPKDGIERALSILSVKDFIDFIKEDQLEPSILNKAYEKFAIDARKLVCDPFLLKQVIKLCENGWKPPMNPNAKQAKYNLRSIDGCVHM